ncbi:MAG: DUF3140 domain-containing protein [Sphingomonas sp.]|nr:DUF3140 domain-containing protein [Sphingomonas sp.]
MPGLDKDNVYREFAEVVNMTPAELEEWLKTDESRKVGWKGRDGTAAESVGHASGRRIVAILGRRPDELTDDDYAHMRKVVGYVRRHLAQRPENQVTSRWRYSLMNWGHDPIADRAGVAPCPPKLPR